MSCSPFELKDYFFEELSSADRAEVDTHLSGCASCRDELRVLDLTRASLLSVPEEEPPRRIAFVSDKVFEPRWWERLWASGPQLGFVSAALLAGAIIVHGYAQKPAATTAQASLPANFEAIVQTEVSKRIEPALAQALAEGSARRTAEILKAVDARLKRTEDRQETQLLVIKEYLERGRKYDTVRLRRAMYDNEVLQ
jgi:hypothetical protein